MCKYTYILYRVLFPNGYRRIFFVSRFRAYIFLILLRYATLRTPTFDSIHLYQFINQPPVATVTLLGDKNGLDRCAISAIYRSRLSTRVRSLLTPVSLSRSRPEQNVQRRERYCNATQRTLLARAATSLHPHTCFTRKRVRTRDRGHASRARLTVPADIFRFRSPLGSFSPRERTARRWNRFNERRRDPP